MKSTKKSKLKKGKQKEEERFLAGIPVLLQKIDSKRIFECTLLNISMNTFTVRFEKNRFDFSINEKFFILIDPEIFYIEDKCVLKINAVCDNIEKNKYSITGKFTEISDTILGDIKIIVQCFKNLNEYEI